MRRIGMERVRVEAEARDREALGRDLIDHLRRAGLREIGDVDMAGPGITARGTASGRPARDFEHFEASAGGPIGDLHEWSLRERCGQEPELHASRSSGADWMTV